MIYITLMEKNCALLKTKLNIKIKTKFV